VYRCQSHQIRRFLPKGKFGLEDLQYHSSLEEVSVEKRDIVTKSIRTSKLCIYRNILDQFHAWRESCAELNERTLRRTQHRIHDRLREQSGEWLVSIDVETQTLKDTGDP
jgi:hypothetical protein